MNPAIPSDTCLTENPGGASLAAHVAQERISTRTLRVTLATGMEDALALVRTAILFARSFRVALHVVVPGEKQDDHAESSITIHFGAARCDIFLRALLGTIEQRLRDAARDGSGGFLVEIRLLPDSGPTLIHVRSTESPRAATALGRPAGADRHCSPPKDTSHA